MRNAEETEDTDADFWPDIFCFLCGRVNHQRLRRLLKGVTGYTVS